MSSYVKQASNDVQQVKSNKGKGINDEKYDYDDENTNRVDEVIYTLKNEEEYIYIYFVEIHLI